MQETMENLVVTITAKQLYDILSRLDALEAANKTEEETTDPAEP